MEPTNRPLVGFHATQHTAWGHCMASPHDLEKPSKRQTTSLISMLVVKRRLCPSSFGAKDLQVGNIVDKCPLSACSSGHVLSQTWGFVHPSHPSKRPGGLEVGDFPFRKSKGLKSNASQTNPNHQFRCDPLYILQTSLIVCIASDRKMVIFHCCPSKLAKGVRAKTLSKGRQLLWKASSFSPSISFL